MDDWEFYHYGNGKWTWRVMALEGQRHSTYAFDSWIEAMADAIQHDFRAGEARIADVKQSRRAEPRVMNGHRGQTGT
jgi:hypothetical protein